MKILNVSMGGKQSTTTASTTASTSSINTIQSGGAAAATERQFGRQATAQYSQHRASLNPHLHQHGLVSNDSRQRARSLSHVPILAHSSAASSSAANNVIGIELASGGNRLFASTSPADSDGGSSTGDESATNSLENALIGVGRVYTAHSLPTQLSSAFNGIKCPVCGKFVIPDDLEYHLVMCLTKPRISYNEDVLSEDKGECVICLEDLKRGDTIARLPCLCIYHKWCIDEWFEVNRSCPEHPSD
ncbi:hypothetical protein CHUAL_003076 [Chamberlinius hualienensis]